MTGLCDGDGVTWWHHFPRLRLLAAVQPICLPRPQALLRTAAPSGVCLLHGPDAAPSRGPERPENCPVDSFQRRAGGSPGRSARKMCRWHIFSEGRAAAPDKFSAEGGRRSRTGECRMAVDAVSQLSTPTLVPSPVPGLRFLQTGTRLCYSLRIRYPSFPVPFHTERQRNSRRVPRGENIAPKGAYP